MKKLLFVCAVLAGCSSRPAPQPAAPKQAAPMSGELEHGMANCPSAVDGAETHLTNTPTGVDVTVTAQNADAQALIVQLAELHTRHEGMGNAPQHTGQHGGPGSIGHCPIIHDGTQISMTSVEGGVVLHVDALAPERVKEVQAQTADRLAAMPKGAPRSASR